MVYHFPGGKVWTALLETALRIEVAIPRWAVATALVLLPMGLVWSAIPEGQPNRIEAVALVGVFWLAILWVFEQKGLL